MVCLMAFVGWVVCLLLNGFHYCAFVCWCLRYCGWFTLGLVVCLIGCLTAGI